MGFATLTSTVLLSDIRESLLVKMSASFDFVGAGNFHLTRTDDSIYESSRVEPGT